MGILGKISSALAPPPAKADDGRDQWPSRTAYLLASCGGAVGMGNMLRYPSQVYNNNGLQWFVPYLMAIFLLAIPAMALEIAAGNAYRGGTVVAYNSINKRLKGTGFALNYVGFVVVTYFVPILAWAMVYFQKSFTSPLPWAGDTENWFMYEAVGSVDPDTSGRWVVHPDVSLDGRLVGWNAFTWFTVWVCMFRGVGLTGRVVYVTMGLPVIMAIVLVGRGASLPNAGEGIKMYFGSWHSDKLAGTKIWRDAVGQVFFSTGVGFGYYTAYASYNRRFSNAAQDAVIIVLFNSFFEAFAAFAVFGIIGYLGMKPEETGEIGSYGLGFMTYPEAFVEMPGSNFFSVVFFFTIMLLGISSSFAMLDAVMTLIMDAPFAKRWGRPWVATAMVTICFLVSLPHCTRFGYYFMDGIDRWINNIGLVFVVWAECVGATTLYRYRDVVGQVGMPSWASYNGGFLGGQLLGITIGHTVTPWAGAIAGFGVYFIGLSASVFLGKAPDAYGGPRLMTKNKMMSVFYYNAFYSGNMLRHDLNTVIGVGKNWSLPFIWAPMLRYVSGPILAIIFSLAYPSFDEVKNDPLHIVGFIVAHCLLLWIVIGYIFPRWYDVFIVHDRRDDWKQPYAPNISRGTTDGQEVDSNEAATSSRTSSKETTAIEDSTVTTATATSFTTTITITTSTSTIPGPAGFTPAASDVSYRAKKREVPKRLYRAMTSINRHKLTLKVNSKKCEYSPALCPQAVNCREVIKTVITKTVTLKQCKKTPTRTVVLPRRTSTKETTTTTTSTSTIIQADETLTNPRNHKTQTSVAPSATFYAACASNNLVSATNGNHGIDSINFNDDTSNNDIIVIGTASAYNCSMACQTTSNCIFSDFAFGGCQLVIGSSCSTAATFGTSYQTNSNVPADRGVVISNGPCGSIQNLGNVGQERTVQ
ncbi:unnamed protein product [Fusarium graminearum]|uniref:Uncharacterized protein n=1 Tax=Gibberella zeae TaxID=5518 RepID=A0A9N8RGU0_GIBZA|nr:unnamed protein product [Fusarium graminearum]